jgi:hypothetical protein
MVKSLIFSFYFNLTKIFLQREKGFPEFDFGDQRAYLKEFGSYDISTLPGQAGTKKGGQLKISTKKEGESSYCVHCMGNITKIVALNIG